MASDLRPIYTAPTAEEASRQLEEFAAKWDATHPAISHVWRRNWERITPFFAFPAAKAIRMKTWLTVLP